MSEPSTPADDLEAIPSTSIKKEESHGSEKRSPSPKSQLEGLLTPRDEHQPIKGKTVKEPAIVEALKQGKVKKEVSAKEETPVKVEPEEGKEKPAKKATKRKRPSTEAEEGKPVDEAAEEKKRRRRERQAASIVCQYQHPNGVEAVMVQCKQRAILGFRFCIRHILQDSEAPYQQCAHQRRPKNKNDMVTRCTNAIRKDSNETFCSTHLIMQGLKEAKKKPHNSTDEASGRSTPHDGSDVASPGQNPLQGSTTSPTEVLSPLCQDADLPRKMPVIKREPVEPGPSMKPLSVATVKNENSHSHLMRALASPGSYPPPPQMHQMPPSQMPLSHMPPGAGRPRVVPPGHRQPAQMHRILIEPKIEPRDYGGPPKPQQQHIRLPPVHSVPSTSAGFHPQEYQKMQQAPQSTLMGQPPRMPQSTQVPQPTQQPPAEKLSCTELYHRMTPAQKAVFEKFRRARAQQTAQAPNRAERIAQLQRVVPPKVGGRPRKLIPEHVARIDRILNKISPQARQFWALSLTSRTGQRMVHQQIPFSLGAVEKVNQQMANRIYQLARKRIPRVAVRSNTVFDTSKLPTSAPPIRPMSPSSDEEDPELNGQPRVIKLRHKRQVRKMAGPYRDVAPVGQMCDKLEDADFDETDLFPLGLEPSDDEYDGLSNSLSVIHPAGMTLTADYKEPSSELYLLRKQLRLERHQLLKTAQMNASIMKSAKLFPVSTGAALRQRNEEAPRPPQLLINTLKRCCQIENKQRCQRSCQPNSNHCNMHVLYNVHQKMYEFCKQSGCRRPVLSIDAHLWDGLCRIHRDTQLQKYGEYPVYADMELPQARAYSRLSSKSDSEDASDSEMEEDPDAPRGDDFDELEDDDEGSVGTP